MSGLVAPKLSRRQVLSGGGALVVSFSILGGVAAQEGEEPQNIGSEPKKAPKLPGSLENEPMLDAWIRIDADGRVTVFTGKVELGQGIKTALRQVAAEELAVDPGSIVLITADTHRTPNEGYTAGSQSMSDGATAILHAAAQVREILLDLAAKRLGLPVERLQARDGAIRAEDGRRVGYGELVSGNVLHVRGKPDAKLKDPASYKAIGKSLQRVDIPSKVTGGVSYVQDLRLPGMVHARVVRPPSYGATLRDVETRAVEQMHGVLRVVRDGSFLAVIAEREFQAITAMSALARAARWDEKPTLPEPSQIYGTLRSLPTDDTVIHDRGTRVDGAKRLDATFHRPYQMHSAIGPSCAVGLFRDGTITVWTHSQGVYPLQVSLADMLRMPREQIRCIHMEGSGCYGHNGADDAAADAALIARAFPDRPVRVQWMREQEHAWEPYGPAMVVQIRAALDGGGSIADWQYEVWSNTHLMRPGRAAGQLMPAWHLETPFQPPPPPSLPQPAGGGDRNAVPFYNFPNAQVVKHFIPAMPIRVSALRALGAYMNVFSTESAMDDLAKMANADPVEFRLRHLDDSRARDVIKLTAERFGWARGARPANGRGYGFAFARYKNLAAYAAVAMEVEVQRETGLVRVRRAVAAVDSGQAVNPDGIRNQIEGGIIQSISWTLYETVQFDRTRITSRDWSRYPILRFEAVPDTLEVHVVDRPGQAYLGTGEAAQGPAAAALANAVANATGVRFRDLPLSPARVRQGLAG